MQNVSCIYVESKKKLIPNDFIQNDKLAQTTLNSFFKGVNI